GFRVPRVPSSEPVKASAVAARVEDNPWHPETQQLRTEAGLRGWETLDAAGVRCSPRLRVLGQRRQEPAEPGEVELASGVPHAVGVAALGHPAQAWRVDPTEVAAHGPAALRQDVLDLRAGEHLRRLQAPPQHRRMIIRAIRGDGDVEAE